ncbi:MAG TPA: CehA/McbA family metallohydrolase [Acidobacteriota bacterium]|nr:CehA/McbA family metallohydrolase [Acidobacteriota bacterium]
MKKSLALVLLALALAGFALAVPATITIVTDTGQLPQPFARIARAGDVFASDGRYAALIAAGPRALWSAINYGHPDVTGFVAAFLPAGRSARPDLQFGYPYLRLGGKTLVTSDASLRPEGNAVMARSSALTPDGQRIDIIVRYTFAFDAGRIDVAAEVRNPGKKEIKGLSASLGANAWQSFNFSPYNAKAFPALNFRVYERPDHALAWLNPNPPETSEKPLPGALRPGQVFRLSYALFAGEAVPELLERLYRAVRQPAVRASLEIKKFEGPAEVMVREPASGAVFFRTFLEKPVPLEIPLPAATYELKANLFPATVVKTVVASATAPVAKIPKDPKDAKSASPNTWTIEAPAFGRVRVAVADRRSRPVPGKVSFIGLTPTAMPYFPPVNPIVSGRSWESLNNEVCPPANGLEVILPAGTYLATASRGPEFAVETRVVEVLSGEPRDLGFTIDRVLETPGLVSVDSHMHTLFSDGSVPVSGRVQSAAAEGVDVVFSADHNTVVDYRPEIARLGLAQDLAFLPGVEVTCRTGSTHMNSLPVALRPDEPNGGAISVRDETPAKLFAMAREKNPGSLIQLNHPRSGSLGYFNNYNLDPEKAAFADHLFDLGFDVMEALNGAKFDRDNRRAIEDWFHLLNRGYPIRIVAASDAHGVEGGETGYARTYVLMAEPVAGAVDEKALVAALKKGRAFISNGPIVAVKANGKATFGDLVAAKKGRVDLDITVTGAPWLDVSEVRVIVNGERQAPLPMKGADGRTVKYRGRVAVDLPSDGWIAVEVLGGRTLYPLIQQRSGDGTPEEAARPYALTNPILVDANGDGRSDPVWPEKVIVK